MNVSVIINNFADLLRDAAPWFFVGATHSDGSASDWLGRNNSLRRNGARSRSGRRSADEPLGLKMKTLFQFSLGLLLVQLTTKTAREIN